MNDGLETAEIGRPFADALRRLQEAGLRPTRQRLALARLLFERPCHHITAEKLHRQATQAAIPVSLATVYNTLHQFTGAGLLREVVVDPSRSYFDTNNSAHHHFFDEDRGELMDIPQHAIRISDLPAMPSGSELRHVDVIIRIGDKD